MYHEVWKERIFPNKTFLGKDDFNGCTGSSSLDFDISLYTVIVMLAPSVDVWHVVLLLVVLILAVVLAEVDCIVTHCEV